MRQAAVKELLEVMRVQRHDFLNHLQVISGLLQLNKTEKVRAYIKSVSEIMEQQGRIMRLGLAEVAAVLLVTGAMAAKGEVELQWDLAGDLVGLDLPGEELASLLRSMLQTFIAALTPPEVEHRTVELKLWRSDLACCWQLVVPAEGERALEQGLSAWRARAKNMAAQLEVKPGVLGGREILLTVPVTTRHEG